MMKQQYIRTSIKNYVLSAVPTTKVILDDDPGDSDEWVKIVFGDIDPGAVSQLSVMLYCNRKPNVDEKNDFLGLSVIVDQLTEGIKEGYIVPYEVPIVGATASPYWKTEMTMEIVSVSQSKDLMGEDEIQTKIILFDIMVYNV